MPVSCTSPHNTRRLCSSAPGGQPKRRAECDAVVRAAFDGGSGVFAGGPRHIIRHQCVKSTSMRVHLCPPLPACQNEDMPSRSTQGATPTPGPAGYALISVTRTYTDKHTHCDNSALWQQPYPLNRLNYHNMGGTAYRLDPASSSPLDLAGSCQRAGAPVGHVFRQIVQGPLSSQSESWV